MRRTKIVCTMGPAVAGVDRLEALIRAGMDVARLNFSHGSHEEHRALYHDVRQAAQRAGRPVAVLGDLCGPKIRVGDLGEGVRLEPGALVTLAYGPAKGEGSRIPHSYEPMARDAAPGCRILFDDGLLEVVVEEVRGDEVICRVKTGGLLKSRKGMNLPGMAVSTPALTEKDKADLAFAVALGVDYLALSFVRNPDDVAEAKALAGDVPIIAKIEKPEAVEQLEAIVDKADGLMVARGDLGVELGHEKVPLVQKRCISLANARAKSVITATQMLNSMIDNPQPTRAEVSDVANAVLDGADAVMLSGETSVGAYPLETVRTMAGIIDEVECSEYYAVHRREPAVRDKSYSNAIADASFEIAEHLEVAGIAVYTETGRSALLTAAHRPTAPIIAFSRHEQVLQRMALYWGVKPLFGGWVQGVKGVVEQAEEKLLANDMVKSGDTIVVTFGMVLDKEPFQTNVLKLWRVRQADTA